MPTHTHQAGVTRILKFPFRPHFLAYQTYSWVMNHELSFLGTSNWHSGNCLRKLQPQLPKHSINKDKTLTIWLENLPNAILEIFYEFFIICDLSNNKNEKQVWTIFNIARDYSVISGLSLAHKNIMQGMRYK